MSVKKSQLIANPKIYFLNKESLFILKLVEDIQQHLIAQYMKLNNQTLRVNKQLRQNDF
ncbi:hypothetical protein TTHERM_000449679 (macronuclear) [Tetrahymena thermophila SB210]|uniref:Uncharacterized protein n=1 Tax=Tetrahymena thermophila (strain SB210) TaxID=312017 RepID=W7XJ04_TETTS|nr:hypothetical protein TTHERM_000449679 [Tetrahymena thermophila SB210]EWS75076.1 hypothetical protein TTHERM_000449679 [Tetrahymena thermophila SB210]|eukprot:XP_012652389.1 hypothetical protein TTHERM_000449679 [Tetrahymena thermophila SB210]